MPVHADDFNVHVYIMSHALISEFAVIAGEPEATLHVNNNITSMF